MNDAACIGSLANPCSDEVAVASQRRFIHPTNGQTVVDRGVLLYMTLGGGTFGCCLLTPGFNDGVGEQVLKGGAIGQQGNEVHHVVGVTRRAGARQLKQRAVGQEVFFADTTRIQRIHHRHHRLQVMHVRDLRQQFVSQSSRRGRGFPVLRSARRGERRGFVVVGAVGQVVVNKPAACRMKRQVDQHRSSVDMVVHQS